MEYTANFDGKDYRVTGAPTADAISLKRVNASTVEATLTLRKEGKGREHRASRDAQGWQDREGDDKRHNGRRKPMENVAASGL